MSVFLLFYYFSPIFAFLLSILLFFFSFFDLIFYRSLFLPSYSPLFFLTHVILSLVYHNLFGIKDLVVIIVAVCLVIYFIKRKQSTNYKHRSKLSRNLA
jgi:hypothetical protein